MKEYFYDLHIHSCLSPCGDEDMTPNNIVNMALLKELDVIALTDHNTAGNCKAVIKAAEGTGLLVIPGMELETSEEIHTVCLFEEADAALEFEKEIRKDGLHIKNKPDIYGRQLYMDEKDVITGEEEELLITATATGIYEVTRLAGKYGGCAFLAHIDRTAHGVLSILGSIDEYMGFKCFELSPNADIEEYRIKYPSFKILKNSDAHYLGQINERESSLFLEDLSVKSIINHIIQPN